MAKRQTKPREKKFRTIALSIFFAVAVWFAVIYVNDPDITTTISDLNVRIVGENALRGKQLAVTGRDNIPELSVVVTGKRSDLINFMDDIYVQVDVNNINTVGDYKLSGSISLPTNRISVEKENYGDIPLTIERLESKNIDVTVRQTGTLKNKLVDSRITNPTVTITGAQSELENVHGAVATVDISHLEGNHTDRTPYLLTDESGALISANETLESERSFVEIESTVYDAKTLPVEAMLSAELEREYILKADKTVIAPSTVTVGVNGDNTAEKVIARIDRPDGGVDGSYTLEASYGMYIPPEYSEVKVRPEIVKKSFGELVLDIEARNTPEGLTAHITNPVQLNLWGEEGSINEDNINAYVDLSGLGAGEYTLPIRIDGDNAGLSRETTVVIKLE